ncbi:S53 family peptidase [Jatrophihabitans fulvus]
MHKRGITAGMVAVTTALVTSVTATGDASAAASPQAVPHTKPAWTAHARSLGHASDSARVHARVYLAPRGGLDAVKQVATAVSTKGNAQYHRFLSSAQYHARFDPTGATVSKVSSYLRDSGLKVGAVGGNNRYVTVTGSAKAARKAFGAQLDRFRHDGRTVQAPTKSLTVPASLRSSILTIKGLDTTPRRVSPSSKQAAPPSAGFRNARPCSIAYGSVKATYKADFKTKLPKFRGQTLSYAPCGYTGPQLRPAYEGDTTLDGTGVTVAITDAYASPTAKKDANTYAARHGDGTYAAGQYYETKAAKFTHQKDCDPSGWYGEETLDIEAVHAMAPGARIHYYGAASCFDDDFLDTLAQVVDDDDSQLVTNSWSDLEANESADSVAAYEAVFLQGATEGISFMFSSGDSGDNLAGSGVRTVDYPSSDPYATSIGGTSTAIGQTGAIDFQTGWGTTKYTLSSDGKSWTSAGYLYGAGGGQSALFNKPDYQQGVVAGPYRNTPDVGLDADPNTGMLVGQTQTFSDGVYYDEYRIGGTSLASPLFAGVTALSLQQAGGRGAGLLNPTIYSSKKAFTDVKGNPPQAGDVRVDYVNGENADDGLTYSVRTFGENGSLATTKGYDNVTGVGAPNPGWLKALAPAS